jgi:hypothetical protein
MIRTWLDATAEFARKNNALPAALEALDAFRTPWPRGGPAPPVEQPWSGDFAAFEKKVLANTTLDNVTSELTGDVDEAQAAMFERRLRAVDQLESDLDRPEGRILRVGLRVRLQGIWAGPAPRAIRVRALADFHHSVLGQLHHVLSGSPGTPLAQELETTGWVSVAKGVQRSTIDGLIREAGPTHISLLRLDPSQVRLTVVHRKDRVTTLPFHIEAGEAGAIAAVSGGFFLYSEPDIEPPSRRYDPVGLVVADGKVLSPPVLRRTTLLAGQGPFELRPIGPTDCTAWIGDHRIDLHKSVNRSSTKRGFDEPSLAIVGERVIAAGRRLDVPLNGLVAPHSPPLPKVGTKIRWEPPKLFDGQAARAGIAGGPTLVRGQRVAIDLRAEDFWGTAPPVTFSQDETGDRFLLPRLAAGLDPQGRLLLAAIDGRNPERALGMTLEGTAKLMLALGCHTAMNLDGGSSKRMVIQGEVVDLPSTEVVAGRQRDPKRIRPVHTGILFFTR